MGHLWVLVSLLSAIGDAVRDLAAKRVLTKNNSMFFTWLIFALPLPVIYAGDIYCGVPHPGPAFYIAIFSALPLEILAQVLYMQALRLSPLSIVAPLLSLTPVFMLAVPFLLIGEKISLVSGAGIVLIAAGAYILNAGAMKKGAARAFESLVKGKRRTLHVHGGTVVLIHCDAFQKSYSPVLADSLHGCLLDLSCRRDDTPCLLDLPGQMGRADEGRYSQ